MSGFRELNRNLIFYVFIFINNIRANRATKMLTQNQCLAVLVVLILILLLWWYFGAEGFHSPYFLDQMAMASFDPTRLNYLGYERGVAGMSERDYYLENQMNASTKVGPQYMKDNTQFADHTGYMGMPIKYRPLRNMSASAAQKQAEIHSNDMEEYAYQDLNQVGHY